MRNFSVTNLPNVLVLAVASCWFSAANADLLSTRLPPDTSLQIVALDVMQNGRRMQIAQLQSDLPAEEVADFYRGYWSSNAEDGAPGSITEFLREWQVVSTISGDSIIVLQLRETQAGGSAGWLSRGELHTTVSRSPYLPEPPGSQLVSKTLSNDVYSPSGISTGPTGQTSSTSTLLLSDVSVERNYEFYRNAMLQRGWRIVAKLVSTQSAALMFSHPQGNAEIALTAFSGSEGTGTLIVANYVFDEK